MGGPVWLAAGLLTLTAGPPAARFVFERGLDGFARSAGRGTLRRETRAALAGTGSMAMTLDAKAHEYRVASPPFVVRPDRIYRVDWQRRIDRGTRLRAFLKLKRGDVWWEVQPTQVADLLLFGTLPGTTVAKVELQVHVPGKALGRSATVDDMVVSEHAPVVREPGANMYWDGSFEIGGTLPPSGWSFWGRRPDKVSFTTDRAHEGRRSLRVAGDRTYVVFPSVPVRARRLYRLTYWVRGQGEIYPAMHKLGARDRDAMRLDRAVRVGHANGTPRTVRLKQDTWQRVELLTVCEHEHVVWFQPYFPLRGGYVAIDDVSLHPLDGT